MHVFLMNITRTSHDICTESCTIVRSVRNTPMSDTTHIIRKNKKSGDIYELPCWISIKSSIRVYHMMLSLNPYEWFY